MSVEDFTSCARHTVGEEADGWNELVIQPLVELANWFKNQNDAVKWIFVTIGGAAGSSAVAWIAKIVGVSAVEVVLPILAAFAGGVGIGTALLAIYECGGQL